MPWLMLFKSALGLAVAIAGLLRERRLLDAGEARATATRLAEIARRIDIADELRDEIEAMSDDELNAALRGDR